MSLSLIFANKVMSTPGWWMVDSGQEVSALLCIREAGVQWCHNITLAPICYNPLLPKKLTDAGGLLPASPALLGIVSNCVIVGVVA